MSQDCIFTLRLFLISYTYHLDGELITGPYTPPPSEQLIFDDDPLHVIGESDLIITPSYNIPSTLTGLEKERGCYSLYIGSRTGDPVRSIKLTALEGVEIGTAIKTLLKTLAWMKATQSCETVTNFIKDQLGVRMAGLEGIVDDLVPGTAGGIIDHRFGSPGTVMWAFSNSTTLISTWYNITSNRATALQRGEEDRFVFFQQLFHHTYGALRFCTPYSHRIHATIRLEHCSYLIPPARFSAPILFVPGQEQLFGGLLLDPDRKSQLLAEAKHFADVMSMSILKRLTGVQILGAVLGQEVASSVLSHSIGSVALDQEEHRLGDAGTSINLTILRKVPLKVTLLSVTLHMAASGVFGQRLTGRRLISILERRSNLGLMGQSATPLTNFLNAIITGGLVNNLLIIGNTWWDWDGSRSVVSLISPLLKAMATVLRDNFWKRWSSEYLHHLQERSKWRDPSENFSVGQLVLVKDERYPPSKWPLGRVTQVHPGPDGFVRVATVKTATTILRRHVVNLCPLSLPSS